MKKLLTTTLFILFAVTLSAQGLFISQKLSKEILGKRIGVPYQHIVDIYGYISPGQKPDGLMKTGQKLYYFYVWIPAAVPELGVRMMSPVPKSKTPKEGDYVLPGYSDDINKDLYFDTWVRIERAGIITKIDDVTKKIGSTTWIPYGENDDSDELPDNPGGNRFNSVLRAETQIGSLPLVVGLYRISFTTYKHGDVIGSFWAQIGTTIKLPGVMIARTVPELVKKVKDYQINSQQ